jgi:DNA mismatch repair protein MSH3
MAPPPSSQKTKQQSISSFFTPKSSAASKASPSSQPIATSARPSTSLVVPQIDKDNVPQRRVSNGSKRRIELQSDEENQEPVAKRSRPSPGATSPPQTSTVGQSKDYAIAAIEESSAVILNGKTTSARTSKYIFSSSPAQVDEEEGSAENTKRKALLHQRFVRKLGKPDSIADIKRRNNTVAEGQGENGDNGEDDEAQEEDDPAPKSTKGKKGGARANGKLTPMEVQYLEIKRKHLDTIIAYEVGYKFRFFGEDARIASKELGIFCIPGKFRYDSRTYYLYIM